MKNSSALAQRSQDCNVTQEDRDYTLIKEIGCSRVSVYEGISKNTGETYAVKIYPYEKDNVDSCFVSSSRFSPVCHQNIISIVDAKECTTMKYKETTMEASIIVMELAPWGDFTNFMGSTNFSKDEKLVRTYFHQLIQGLEFLHSNKIYHLDIKTDNILLGKDFKLKLTDFDCSYVRGDESIRSRGTRHYRPKEVKENRVSNPAAADVYSAGVCLFVLLEGCLPFLEDELVEGVDLLQLAQKKSPLFWDMHKRLLGEYHFSADFKSLFFSMVREDPSERISIEQIKRSAWYRGPTYSEKELVKKMSKLLKEAQLL